MKRILLLFFILTTNLSGSQQQSLENSSPLETMNGFSVRQPVQYMHHSANGLDISQESIYTRSSSIIDRIDSLICRFTDMLSQDSFPDDFQENSLLSIAREIDRIIASNISDVVVSALIQEQSGTQSVLQSSSLARELIEGISPITRHISSIFMETNQDLFAKCIDRNWFETATWIMKHASQTQRTPYYGKISAAAKHLIQKYNDVGFCADTEHHQDILDDLHKATAMIFLMQAAIRTENHDPSIYENLKDHIFDLTIIEQLLSVISDLQLLVLRIETESNEANLDQLKNNLDQTLSTIARPLVFIHKLFNHITLPKSKQFLSLIDLCTEKRFFSTILWAVGKGVPLQAGQIVKMFDVAVEYLQNKDAYLCEKEDLFSLLHLIIQAVKQNMMSKEDKEALEQLQPKILSKIANIQEMKQHLPEGISLPLYILEESNWDTLLTLIQRKLQGRGDYAIQWELLSSVQQHAVYCYRIFQESRSSLNEEMINLVKEQQDLISEVIRLLSLNPSDEPLLESIRHIEIFLNQEYPHRMEIMKNITNDTSPEELSPHERHAEIFRIVSSGECSREELERCCRILSLLSPDEINDVGLWRGTPLVMRIASLACEGNWAYDLFKIIFSKPNIDVSSLVKNQDGEIVVSQQYIHDVSLEKELKEYFRKNS